MSLIFVGILSDTLNPKLHLNPMMVLDEQSKLHNLP